MTTHTDIDSFGKSDEVLGFYILNKAQSKIAKSGKPFLNGELSDGSGKIGMVFWDYAGPICEADVGKVVKVQGTVSEYQGAPQLSVARMRIATDADEYDIAALVPTAPIDHEKYLERIRELIRSIEDLDYRHIAEMLLERSLPLFASIPAAKSVHHAFIHGLLMHTADMLDTADFLASKYQGIINRSLLLAGTLGHDLGKTREFALSELGLVTDYSLKGQLIGHSVMGAQDVANIAAELGVSEEKSLLLQHMILSHHREPEFGAAVRPLSAEAELLSAIDLIDSRMEIYREAYANTPVGEFSDKIFGLDWARIYHHE